MKAAAYARCSADRQTENSIACQEVEPAAIAKLLQDSVDSWDDAALPQIVRQHVTKIYAHTDGAYTVNVGVHLSGCGGRT